MTHETPQPENRNMAEFHVDPEELVGIVNDATKEAYRSIEEFPPSNLLILNDENFEQIVNDYRDNYYHPVFRELVNVNNLFLPYSGSYSSDGSTMDTFYNKGENKAYLREKAVPLQTDNPLEALNTTQKLVSRILKAAILQNISPRELRQTKARNFGKYLINSGYVERASNSSLDWGTKLQLLELTEKTDFVAKMEGAMIEVRVDGMVALPTFGNLQEEALLVSLQMSPQELIAKKLAPKFAEPLNTGFQEMEEVLIEIFTEGNKSSITPENYSLCWQQFQRMGIDIVKSRNTTLFSVHNNSLPGQKLLDDTVKKAPRLK